MKTAPIGRKLQVAEILEPLVLLDVRGAVLQVPEALAQVRGQQLLHQALSLAVGRGRRGRLMWTPRMLRSKTHEAPN